MSEPLYFSAKSIGQSKKGNRKPQSLLVAARHNLRDLQAEYGADDSIALELSHLNVILHGATTPKSIDAYADSLKVKYAVPQRKLRKDHVQALEFVISVRSDSGIDWMEYFRASMQWLKDIFGDEMILSAVVHLDEGTPHMHALVLPIVDGEYQGGTPIDKPRLRKLTQKFADQVGKHFGFSFSPKKKLSAAQRQAGINLVVDRLSDLCDPVVSSVVWRVVLESIKREPLAFMDALELEMPECRSKSVKDWKKIMMGTGKKTSEDRELRRTHDLSCVGKQNFHAPISFPESAHEAA